MTWFPDPVRLPAALNWRRRSLVRGTSLVLVGTIVAFRLSHFPECRETSWLLLPLALSLLGTADTVRCMQRKWNWYHGGVVLLIYMDLMAVGMVLFFLVYPLWL